MRKKKEQAIITHIAAHDIFGQFRYFKNEDDGGIWWVAVDVAKFLGYKNCSRDVNRHVDPEDRKVVKLSTETVPNYSGKPGSPNKIIINESGLYSLIFGSKLPEAKKFKRWVTSEVLPSIRKTGIYSVAKKYVETNQCVDLYEEFDNGEFEVTSFNNATIEYDEKGKMIRVLDENLKTVWE